MSNHLNKMRLPGIVRLVARIVGAIVILIPLIALTQVILGNRVFNTDWQNIVLYSSLIFGLLLAFKWELIGGAITTIGVIISGFVYPLILVPGILYMLSWFMNDGKAKKSNIKQRSTKSED